MSTEKNSGTTNLIDLLSAVNYLERNYVLPVFESLELNTIIKLTSLTCLIMRLDLTVGRLNEL